MILTDREIQIFLSKRQILIKPEPDPIRYCSTAVDLTLHNQLLIWTFDQVEKTKGEIVNLDENFKWVDFKVKYTKSKKINPDTGYVLNPQDFILGWTHEKITLPNHSRIAARVEGKSSQARVGLGVHITAPTIHAGFNGRLQLELCNHGKVSIRLIPGMPICQLIFEITFGTPLKGYSGVFSGQMG
jgi:dCTP deaminase